MISHMCRERGREKVLLWFFRVTPVTQHSQYGQLGYTSNKPARVYFNSQQKDRETETPCQRGGGRTRGFL